MSVADDFRRCLEECDVEGIRRLHAHAMPHMPAPQTDAQALISIHLARTQSESIALKLRAYSHRWLVDNSYPSQLPDSLRPKAERLYPKVVDGVGISIGTKSELMKPVVVHIQRAMSDAVLECYEDGKKEPAFVKARMADAREGVVQKLLGIRP